MRMGWQGREVKAFLVETWELFYWSLWCPSKLQERIDRLNKDSWSSFALIPDTLQKFRFLGQYLLISLVLAIPTIVASINLPSPLNYLFPISSVFTAYGLGVLDGLIPIALAWAAPLIFTIVAPQLPTVLTQRYQQGLVELAQIFSSWTQLAWGLAAGFSSLSLSSTVGFWLMKHKFNIGRMSLVAGSASSIFLGSWIVTQNLFDSSLLTGLSGVSILILFLRGDLDEDLDEVALVGSVTGVVVALLIVLLVVIVVLGIVLGITGGIVVAIRNDILLSSGDHILGIVAFTVTGIITDVARLTLLLYLITCATLGFGFAPTKNHRWALGLILAMLLLGFANLHLTVIWAIPTILLCYYRIFPDYVIFIIPSLLDTANQFTLSWLKNITPKTNALAIARRFPLFDSEILWFPIPRHDLVLINAFEQSPAQTLTIYQKFQDTPLPGPQITIKKALPGILANCFKAPRTTADLLQVQTQDHPQLPLLIPEYYQQSIDEDAEPIAPINRQPEIAIIFPRLQTFLNNLSVTLANPSAALRDRGLESLQNQLTQLQLQLPSLLPPKSVTRWQGVLTHWQTLLQLELEEQRKQSQGELVSFFQYGNPLKPRDAFKGRRTLADRLYRLILDRNRPTLVLHGPRRFGKTSFLNNLPRLLPTDLIPIYLDLQSSALNSSEPDFCYGLVRAILRDTRNQNLPPLPPSPSRDNFKTNPYTTLEDWLDQALPLIPQGQRLLLNLDEFEKIGSAIADGKLSLNLLNELRHLIQHRDELAFMFSGVQTLDELGPNWSSYFISVVPIEMLYLEPHEAEDLLRNPDPDFKMRYEDGLIDRILQITHCQPYLLQLIGACLVEQANLATVKTATHALLDLAIPEAFTNGAPYFTNLWQEFTGTTTQEIAAGQQILIHLTNQQQPDLTSIASQAAHRRLRRFHLIETLEDGTDRIEIPMVEMWVRDRAIDL